MKKVQCRKKKIHATSPQKFGDWSFTNFEKIKILFRQNNVSAVVFMEDTAVRDAAPRMSCAVLASAAWRALKQNNVSAVVFMEDTAVRDAAPRMSCAVLAAAAW